MTAKYIALQTKNEIGFMFSCQDYEFDTQAFQEKKMVIITHKNGDGIGDFYALAESIDHICFADEDAPDTMDYDYLFEDEKDDD